MMRGGRILLEFEEEASDIHKGVAVRNVCRVHRDLE